MWKTSSKEYHNSETAKSDECEQIEKKTSNNCSVKSGQLRVTSLVLEEQLKVANKKLHSEATYKLGLDIQTKNGTTWRCSEKNLLFMFSSSSHYQICQWSHQNYGQIYSYCMFGCDLKPLPCTFTVHNMVSEIETFRWIVLWREW